MRQLYPLITSFTNALDWMREVARIRSEDIVEWQSLPQQYVTGRRTTRVPTANNDVISGDAEGDIVYAANASHMYILVDKSGTLTWARISLDTTW
jgi:hypothetical protein